MWTHRQDGARSPAHDVFRHRAQEELSDAGSAACAQDQQVNLFLIDHRSQDRPYSSLGRQDVSLDMRQVVAKDLSQFAFLFFIFFICTRPSFRSAQNIVLWCSRMDRIELRTESPGEFRRIRKG